MRGELLRKELERGAEVLPVGHDGRDPGHAAVTGVQLADGGELPADLVVMATGVRPNIELAQVSWACAVTAASSSMTRCRALIRPSTRWASASSIVTAPSGWSRRYGNRRACARRTWPNGACAAISGSQVSTQLKVSGIKVFSAGDSEGRRGPRVAGDARSRAAASTSGCSLRTTRCAAPCCTATRRMAAGTLI